MSHLPDLLSRESPPDLEVLWVQEAIFYDLPAELINITITALVRNGNTSGQDLSLWLVHERSVHVEDIMASLVTQTGDDIPDIATAISLQRTADGTLTVRTLRGTCYDAAVLEGVRLLTLSNPPPGRLLEQDVPYTVFGFSPIPSGHPSQQFVVRAGLRIEGSAFHRLVRQIKGYRHFFYAISGPSIVLTDIENAHLQAGDEAGMAPYRTTFHEMIRPAYVQTKEYDVLTLDPESDGVVYTRGLAQAEHCIVDTPVETRKNGTRILNAWHCVSDDFMIQRASISSIP